MTSEGNMNDTMSEGYQSWVERVAADRPNKPLEAEETVSTPPDVPVAPMQFVRVERKGYVGEVGKKGGDYIFHFFPKDNQNWSPDFGDKLGDAFLEVFRNPDRVEASWADELNSWAVRARGYADNPLADELAVKVFDVLDRRLEK
jgi:hypothetical protein